MVQDMTEPRSERKTTIRYAVPVVADRDRLRSEEAKARAERRTHIETMARLEAAARNPNLDGPTRARVLTELDTEIAWWRNERLANEAANETHAWERIPPPPIDDDGEWNQ